jgi:enediyne biosynthesis protein E4
MNKLIRILGFPPLMTALWLGCSPAPEPAQKRAAEHPAWFEEAAAQAGIEFQWISGHDGTFYFPEIMGGGVCLLDFDGDGFLDVYLVQGGYLGDPERAQPGNRLFRNLGDGRFEDVTEDAGVGDTGYGMGCACADFDGDGLVDIYVTNVGENVLYRNNGDGTFSNVTEQAGVGDPGWGTSAAFFDFDHDGHLDLVVVNYIHWSPETEIACFSRGGQQDYCSPMSYEAPSMDTLFRNRGDGTFENVTRAAGLHRAYGTGLGVVTGDFNGNGRPDIYVANDAMPNQLWINQGDGTFQDEALLRGCAVNYLGISEAGMGVVAMDLTGNGRLDLFITHLTGEANRLYVNEEGLFTDHVSPRGPGSFSWPWTGFGVGFADFNNNGILDLYVANGRVKYGHVDLHPDDPYAEPNNLLRGLGNLEFEELPNGGLPSNLLANSRGLAIGDLNNDGGLDVLIVNRDAPFHLLRNVAPDRGNWIKFQVLNEQGREAVGARVRIEAGGTAQWRQAQPNEGYCSSNDPRVHFGLGDATGVAEVKIHWPDGREQVFGPFDANAIYTLRPIE